jgi:hypothetical protein
MPIPIAPAGYTLLTGMGGQDPSARPNNTVPMNTMLKCSLCSSVVQGVDAGIHLQFHTQAFQQFDCTLPAFILTGGTVDVPVVWPVPMLRSTYTILRPQIFLPISILTKVAAEIKAGTKTLSGATMTVTANGLLSAAAGTISVYAIGVR